LSVVGERKPGHEGSRPLKRSKWAEKKRRGALYDRKIGEEGEGGYLPTLREVSEAR